MKYLFLAMTVLGLSAAQYEAHAEDIQLVDGKVTEEQRPFVERFVGTYSARDNSLFSEEAGTVTFSIDSENRLSMASTMEITGGKCQSTIGSAVALTYYPGDGVTAPVEVQFFLDRGNCGIAGKFVTFHYNKALFSDKDIFLAEILIKTGRNAPPRRVPDIKKVWVLKQAQ